MGCSVFEIERWPASHLEEWRQFYLMHPFGSWRDNWHAALVASTIANVNRKPGSSPYNMSDFFFKDAETAQKEKDMQMLAWLEAKANG